MSTLTTTRPALATQVRPASSVGFGRLSAIELRKLVDTRAARWLLAATAATAALGAGAMVLVATSPDLPPIGAQAFVATSTGAVGLLLPVMAILLVASEWTQRGALVTFTLEPRRLRVLAAKLVAAVVAAVAMSVLAAGMGYLTAVGFDVASGGGMNLRVDPGALGWLTAETVLGTVQGVALGVLLMNTAAAVAVFLLAPIALQFAGLLGPQIAEIVSWISTTIGMVQVDAPLDGGAHWGKVAVTTAFWVVLPLVLGAVRLLRHEVK